MQAADGVLVLTADLGTSLREVIVGLSCAPDEAGALVCAVGPITEGRPRPVPAAVAAWLGDLAAERGRPLPGSG